MKPAYCNCGSHLDPRDSITITDYFPDGSVEVQVFDPKDRLVRRTKTTFPQLPGKKRITGKVQND